MHGIVTLLPEPLYHTVEKIWRKLETKFGISLKEKGETLYPHFSWQMADEYDIDKLKVILENIALKTEPFTISTCGIGIFSVERPIIYIPIVKTEELIDLHKSICKKTAKTADGISDLYSPENWMPHISIAFEGITKENIGEIITELSNKNYIWNFELNNISFFSESESKIGKLAFKIKLKKS